MKILSMVMWNVLICDRLPNSLTQLENLVHLSLNDVGVSQLPSNIGKCVIMTDYFAPERDVMCCSQHVCVCLCVCLHVSKSTYLTYKIFYTCFMWRCAPSVLWRCWFGDRKGIWPVKNWAVGCWHGYLSGARCRLAYGPADSTATHCLLLQ